MPTFLSRLLRKTAELPTARKLSLAVLLGLFVFFLVFVLRQYTSLNSYHPRDFAAEANPIVRTVFAGRFFDSMALCSYPFFLQTHLSITPFLMLPFVAVAPSGITLLVLATALIFAGLVFLWLTARHLLHDDLLALLVALAFLLYLPVQNNLLNDWRYNFLYIPAILATFHFYITRRFVPFLVAFLVTMLTRDEGILVVSVFPLAELLNPLLLRRLPHLAWHTDRLRKRFVIAPAVSILLSFLLLSILFKKLVPRWTGYDAHLLFLFEKYGSTTLEVAKTVLLNPLRPLRDILQPQKLAFFAKDIFLPLLFLPLLGPQGLLFALPTIGLYLVFDYPQTLSISSPYSVETAGVRYLTFFLSYLGISLAYAVKNLSALLPKRPRLAYGLSIALLLVIVAVGVRNSPLPFPGSAKHDPRRFTLTSRDRTLKHRLFPSIRRHEGLTTQFDYLAWFLGQTYLADVNHAYGFDFSEHPLGDKLLLDLRKRWYFNLDHFFHVMWRFRNASPGYELLDAYDAAFLLGRLPSADTTPSERTRQFWDFLFSSRFPVNFHERYAYRLPSPAPTPTARPILRGENLPTVFPPSLRKTGTEHVITLPILVPSSVRFRPKTIHPHKPDERGDNLVLAFVFRSPSGEIRRTVKPVPAVRFWERDRTFLCETRLEPGTLQGPAQVWLHILEEREPDGLVPLTPNPILLGRL